MDKPVGDRMQRSDLNTLLTILVVALLLIGAWYLFTGGRGLVGPDQQTEQGGGPGRILPDLMRIDLRAVDTGNIDQKGTAILTEEDGRVRVNIDLNKVDNLAAPQPAHIHAGSCPGVGEIIFPLNNVINGRSETIINTTLDQLRREMPLTINVHKSVQESSIYTSCGNF